MFLKKIVASEQKRNKETQERKIKWQETNFINEIDTWNGPLGALHWIQVLITYELSLLSTEEAYGVCVHHCMCVNVCVCV